MNWWFPTNASSYGAEIDRIFFLILYITGFTLVAVEVALVWFLWKYRTRAGHTATYVEGSVKAEVIWTAVPTIAVVFLGLFSQPLWSRIKDNDKMPADAVVYDVTGKQFEWQIVYPGPDGRLGTDDDFNKRNELHVVVDRNVIVRLHGEDVIHSFFVPHMRVKQDVVPGLEHNQAWFRPTRTGEFEIACAELCGLGHYRMRGRVFVHTAAEFDAWQTRQIAPPAEPAADSAAPGRNE